MISYLLNLNNSKYFAGLTMILINLGSKYLAKELSDTQEDFLNNIMIRRVILFTVVFMATKDIVVSFIITAIFIVLVSGLFNENSRYCILNKGKCKKKKISEKEFLEAKKVIQLYELQSKLK